MKGYLYTVIRERAQNGEVRNLAVALVEARKDGTVRGVWFRRRMVGGAAQEAAQDVCRQLVRARDAGADALFRWGNEGRTEDFVYATALRPGVTDGPYDAEVLRLANEYLTPAWSGASTDGETTCVLRGSTDAPESTP